MIRKCCFEIRHRGLSWGISSRSGFFPALGPKRRGLNAIIWCEFWGVSERRLDAPENFTGVDVIVVPS